MKKALALMIALTATPSFAGEDCEKLEPIVRELTIVRLIGKDLADAKEFNYLRILTSGAETEEQALEQVRLRDARDKLADFVWAIEEEKLPFLPKLVVAACKEELE